MHKQIARKNVNEAKKSKRNNTKQKQHKQNKILLNILLMPCMLKLDTIFRYGLNLHPLFDH